MIEQHGLFLIAGSGDYPFEVIKGARRAGITRIIAAAFEGETNPQLAEKVDQICWMRVGELGKLLKLVRQSVKEGVAQALMAGQIAPKNLFALRPDFKAMMLLATLPQRNAATLFEALAQALEKEGGQLLLATTFMEESLAHPGVIAGPQPRKRQLSDIDFGYQIVKEVSRLNIGQTVVVKKGTVLAVEGFDGTDATLQRGGMLGKGESVMVKVSQPNQDLRFDVPVIGMKTLEVAASSGISLLAVEAGKTLLLNAADLKAKAKELSITLWGI